MPHDRPQGPQSASTQPDPPCSSAPRRRADYSEVEIEKGLTALALCSGNASRASRELENVGFHLSRRTLSDWKKSHGERYREIQAQVQPEINAEIAETSEAIVRRLTEVEWDLIGKIEEEMPNMTGTQAATALQRATWSKGVNADKSRTYRDLPVEIRRTEGDAIDAMRAIVARFPGVLPQPVEQNFKQLVEMSDDTIESTAVEEGAS